MVEFAFSSRIYALMNFVFFRYFCLGLVEPTTSDSVKNRMNLIFISERLCCVVGLWHQRTFLDLAFPSFFYCMV